MFPPCALVLFYIVLLPLSFLALEKGLYLRDQVAILS